MTHIAELVLRFIKNHRTHGATDEEVEQALGLTLTRSGRPARRHLVKAGLVMDSGRTRLTLSGNPATVWIAA